MLNLDLHELRRVEPTPADAISPLLGKSAAMQEVMRLIERVAPTDASVLLTGESGSGKEPAALAIHQQSRYRNGPFATFKCGAVPDSRIEAELFGPATNGFSRASPVPPDTIERGGCGTVLLDEITEMPWELQTRLLRELETRKSHRVIAATNRCPLQAVETGKLREDLLYRLAVFPIALPPLRDRGGDVHLLAEHFLSDLNRRVGLDKQFSADARALLEQHSWPGNVRELKNCVERAFILCDDVLELSLLGQSAAPPKAAPVPENRLRVDIRVGSRIEDMERTLIEATLDHFQGNKRRSADALGCSLKTLYNKLNGYSQNQQFADS